MSVLGDRIALKTEARKRYKKNQHFLPDGHTPKAAKDEAGARIAAVEMSERLGRPLSAYRCPVCSAWHVGRDKTPGSQSELLMRTQFDITWEVELGRRTTQFLFRESTGPVTLRRRHLRAYGRTIERIRKRDYPPPVTPPA